MKTINLITVYLSSGGWQAGKAYLWTQTPLLLLAFVAADLLGQLSLYLYSDAKIII